METEQQSESPDLARSPSTWQKPNNIALVPYVQIDGKWTLPDELVLSLCRQVEREGTFRRVFYEGHIRTPKEFLDAMKKPANVPVFLFKGTEPLGFAWLNGISGNVGFAHFCFLKKSWGRESMEMGRLLISYWMSFSTGDNPVLDVIIGNIPTMNPKAIAYVQRIGFELLGEIPGMMVDTYTGERYSAAVLFYSRFKNVQEGRKQRRQQ